MNKALRIALGQINPITGNISHNLTLMADYAAQAAASSVDVLVFPELSLLGYPPEDLLYRSALFERLDQAVDALKTQSLAWQDLHIVFGLPVFYKENQRNRCYNALTVISNGQIVTTYKKQFLPNYGVFDEARYFVAANQKQSFTCKGVKLALTICEDIWSCDTITDIIEQDAQIIVSINASPFYQNKQPRRENIVKKRADEAGIPLVYCNLVGGQDELIFDGGSVIALPEKGVVHRLKRFEQLLSVVNLEYTDSLWQCPNAELSALSACVEEEIYQAIVVGTRDYFHKNGFKKALLGLSGGIDSSLTLAVAVDALGAENVTAIMMPFKYTAQISQDDAAEQAKRMGANYLTLPIESAYDSFMDILAKPFKDTETDVTEQNIQARCRGLILMAISNKTGALVLTTGNKSELAVGYATLYGDMSGAYCVPKDVYKVQVYALARYRNTVANETPDMLPPIPERVITREPSAELAPDQKDSDNLPEYELLDAILALHIEGNLSKDDIVKKGYDDAVVSRVLTLVKRSEYKRNQAAPGPRVTKRAFGKDWRLPLTNGMPV